MGSSYSLFTNVGPIPPQYQVFINFRGEKLRDGFLGFLVGALLKANVNVFIDDHELRGRDLDHLFNRIEESRVAVTIFSKNFTESRWCLDELAKIKECLDKGSIQVIPIFFKMKTDDVKKLKGRFGDNFRDLKSTHHGEPGNFRRWKEALMCVSRKAGLSSSRYRSVLVSFILFLVGLICFSTLFLDSVFGSFMTITQFINRSATLCYDSSQQQFVSAIVEDVVKVLKDIAKSEKQIVEAKRNHFAARTEDMIKSFVYIFSLILLFTLVLGPYLLGLISVFYFLLGRSIISRAIESER